MARARKQRRTKIRPGTGPQEALVSPFAAQHGDYRQALVVDLSGELGGRRQSMVRVLVNRSVSTVDRWLFEGGPGFEEPQARAIEHVRSLWRRLGAGGRLVADYSGAGPVDGGRGDREGWLAALHQLEEYERRIGIAWVWKAFENVVRHDMPAGRAGARLAAHSAEQRAHAKACVGFVASKIAEWRGF